MAPCLVVLVELESIVLLCKQVDIGELSFVISESDIVTLFAFSFNRSRSPEVTMHLSSKNFRSFTFPHLWNDFPGRFHINTRFTEERIT